RRGYFIEGLGAAQFATPATVDRLRAVAADRETEAESADPQITALTLSATDPANPFGAALGWPTLDDERHGGHRPGRKAGGLVVLVDGALGLFIERGGKTVLSFVDDPDQLQAAANSLASTIRATGGRLRVEKVDGVFAIGTPLGEALTASGFAPTPQGLRLRA
ncbi:MAG: ATP-dependent helicase, partial [Pseudolysinimonas sp.]